MTTSLRITMSSAFALRSGPSTPFGGGQRLGLRRCAASSLDALVVRLPVHPTLRGADNNADDHAGAAALV